MTITEYRSTIEQRLQELFDLKDVQPVLREAMHYSICAGGKRIRPVLHMMANAACRGDLHECLDVACAIEMIHTYSLIHDDLPAMDNDELRRGKPTNHIVFGEAFAILAGDGLLSYAYEVMLKNALLYPSRALIHVRAMDAIAKGSGTCGMLTGQCADIENEGQVLTEHELRFLHAHKTGEMITCALVSGAILAGAPQETVDIMRQYGEHVGIAFQIIDDILDIEGSAGSLAKHPEKMPKRKNSHSRLCLVWIFPDKWQRKTQRRLWRHSLLWEAMETPFGDLPVKCWSATNRGKVCVLLLTDRRAQVKAPSQKKLRINCISAIWIRGRCTEPWPVTLNRTGCVWMMQIWSLPPFPASGWLFLLKKTFSMCL